MLNRQRMLSPTGTFLLPLEKKIFLHLKSMRAELENKILLVGVSGGLDSTVLLHVFHALSSRLKTQLHIVHVNHGVRGSISDLDSKFVSQLARSLKIPVTVLKIQNTGPRSSENLLREKRYEALHSEKKKIGANYITVAHHRDDLLETRLMRLLQGTGTNGLKGMGILNQEGDIFRPFLLTTRREIEQYALDKDIKWRNDATNLDTAKLRNWIRIKWLGVLRLGHPEYIENLINSLERMAQPTANSRATLGHSLKRYIEFSNEEVYNYLRHFSKQRVTSRHVVEFKKRLTSIRKEFTFRLAGVDWNVSERMVEPRPSRRF